VALIVPLYVAIGLLHRLLHRQMTGAGPLVWEFIFYATFGVVVTSSVAIAGVLLVFSFLIIPAAIGVMFASSLARQLAIGWTAGIVTSAAGLAASFAFDLPTGAAMVCAFGASLALAGLLYPFLRGDRRTTLHAAIAAVRWCVAALLAASALQLAAAPRADQPLIDFAEYLLPSLRTLYFSPAEQATFVEAGAYAERYRAEAEDLNDREKRNRTEGEVLDDYGVARISSFLKSYGEMRKGEQFVMGEVRARARERVRWIAGLGLFALALLLAPVPWRRLWARHARQA
jgi:zinc/manganese transport system permease protein